MLVAITAEGAALKDLVCERFGRAPMVLIYDTYSSELTILDNQTGREAASGAGVQMAQRIVDSGAQVLLTGHCGPKAFKVMEAANIRVIAETQGTVKEAIRQFKRGDVEVNETPDVPSRW